MATPPTATFGQRAQRFFRYLHERRDDPRTTIWGPYRCFDGWFLASAALAERAAAREGFDATVAMIRENLDDEAEDPNWKWHLADFAMHPLLRTRLLYPEALTPAQRSVVRELGLNYLYHDGDLSENHNLLHWSLQFLTAERWPDGRFADRRDALEHRQEARWRILHWSDRWLREGSAEWGADIYQNVLLLALNNLADFARDPVIAGRAHAIRELVLLDEALDAFDLTLAGAARRGYAVYRQALTQSPSRPLLYLYFGDNAEERADDYFTDSFVGGVLCSATSPYRPPALLGRIARGEVGACSHQQAHRAGMWGHLEGTESYASWLGKYTRRDDAGMLSVMLSPGGPLRYTEHVVQATFGNEALVFANHPSFGRPTDKPVDVPTVLEEYTITEPAEGPPFHIRGNMPPGHEGDIRPGYWQGNGHGPRSFGSDDFAALIWDLPADAACPWVHLWCPVAAFDSVVREDHWIFLRKGEGALALWCDPAPLPTTTGYWAGREERLIDPRAALFMRMGKADTDEVFANFQQASRALAPTFDREAVALRFGDWWVGYADGAAHMDKPVPPITHRWETPWGALPLGETAFTLDVEGAARRFGWEAAAR